MLTVDIWNGTDPGQAGYFHGSISPENARIMRSFLHSPLPLWILLILTACVTANPGLPSVATVEQPDPKILGVFEGMTPCNQDPRPLPEIPEDADCDQMIWKFTLYQDPSTGMPTTYELNAAFGISEQGTPGLTGGIPIVMQGKWAIVNGTKTDPDAVVYRLNPDIPEDSVSFVRISDDILHVLNQDGTLLVGNGAWSYTLYRTDNRTFPQITNAGAAPVPETPLVDPATPVRSSVLGIFDGRMPCHEIVFEFMGLAPYPRCVKIKMRLTLYQDTVTRQPGAYMLRGTSTIRTGTWTILRGTQWDRDATVYRLDSDELQNPVSFLKADDNHLFLLDRGLNPLVGNARFSYTLSRAIPAAR